MQCNSSTPEQKSLERFCVEASEESQNSSNSLWGVATSGCWLGSLSSLASSILKCLLDCKLVNSMDTRPILGRKAYIGMKIIKYSNNDAINKPQTNGASVHVIDDNSPNAVHTSMTEKSLVETFPRDFAKKVGQLDGEYHVKIDTAITPVQHAPRRVPVALRTRLKAELDEMEQQGVITFVTTPTA